MNDFMDDLKEFVLNIILPFSLVAIVLLTLAYSALSWDIWEGFLWAVFTVVILDIAMTIISVVVGLLYRR